MSEQEWRDCFAMFRSVTGASAEECYAFADEMLKARNPKEETGIVAVKRSSTKKEK